MRAILAEVVTQSCLPALDELDVPGLQAHVGELRDAIGRLQGRLDQALAALEDRSGGKVLEHAGSERAPLYTETRTGWREEATISGGQAGRDFRRVGILRRLPVLAQARSWSG